MITARLAFRYHVKQSISVPQAPLTLFSGSRCPYHTPVQPVLDVPAGDKLALLASKGRGVHLQAEQQWTESVSAHNLHLSLHGLMHEPQLLHVVLGLHASMPLLLLIAVVKAWAFVHKLDCAHHLEFH